MGTKVLIQQRDTTFSEDASATTQDKAPNRAKGLAPKVRSSLCNIMRTTFDCHGAIKGHIKLKAYVHSPKIQVALIQSYANFLQRLQS